MDPVPQFLKRLESRVALALARSLEAIRAFIAAANHTDTVLAITTAPAVSSSFSAPAFVSGSGVVRVMAWVTVSAGGGTMVAADQLSIFLQRDGVSIPVSNPMGGLETVQPGAPTSGLMMSTAADDSSTPGSHIYSVHVTCSGGHTASLIGGNTEIILQELPA